MLASAEPLSKRQAKEVPNQGHVRRKNDRPARACQAGLVPQRLGASLGYLAAGLAHAQSPSLGGISLHVALREPSQCEAHPAPPQEAGRFAAFVYGLSSMLNAQTGSQGEQALLVGGLPTTNLNSDTDWLNILRYGDFRRSRLILSAYVIQCGENSISIERDKYGKE